MAVNSSLYKSMPFNPLKDLEPVVQLSAFPLVLEVHPSLGVKTVAELLALAKTGKTLSFASAGNGTPSTWRASCATPWSRSSWAMCPTGVRDRRSTT